MEIEMDKCLSNAGGTREDFNKLLQGTDIPKLKCFWECMMKADGSVIILLCIQLTYYLMLD